VFNQPRLIKRGKLIGQVLHRFQGEGHRDVLSLSPEEKNINQVFTHIRIARHSGMDRDQALPAVDMSGAQLNGRAERVGGMSYGHTRHDGYVFDPAS
jgi:hypothetical protein